MKKYFKNGVLGVIIGLALIPIIYLELYYIDTGSYMKELTNLSNINVLKELVLIIIIIGFSIGLLIASFLEFLEDNKNIEFKNNQFSNSVAKCLKLIAIFFITILAQTLLVKLIDTYIFNKILSEDVIQLIILNVICSLPVCSVLFVIHQTIKYIEIAKINKKLKMNNFPPT